MSTLQINADLKYIEFLLHFICNSDNSKTIKDLKAEFKGKFQIDLPHLLNQNFGIMRLIPLLLIREDLKNRGEYYDKKITIIRHALAHNKFSMTENGYEFFSDRGNCKLNYKEFTDFIHKIEVEDIGVPDSVGRFFQHLPLAGKLHHAGLVPAFQQSGKQQGVNLPFKVSHFPTLFFGLYLIEQAFIGVLDAHQNLIMRPAEHRRKSSRLCGVFHRRRHVIINARPTLANGIRRQNARSNLANLGMPIRIDGVKGSEITKVGR